MTDVIDEGLPPGRSAAATPKRPLRRTLRNPGRTHSSRRLNALFHRMAACSTYLEVGVAMGRTFESVEVPFRWGVDPAPGFLTGSLPPGARFSTMPSDEFFETLPPQQRFDLIFLDGLHEWSQTYRDLLNSLNHAPCQAVILIDDVVPDDEHAAIPDLRVARMARAAHGIESRRWQGDVYKVVLAIQQDHPELEMVLIADGTPTGHKQALVWRRAPERRVYEIPTPGQTAERFADVGYADVFPDGRPSWGLEFLAEDEGVERAYAASNRAWAATQG